MDDEQIIDFLVEHKFQVFWQTPNGDYQEKTKLSEPDHTKANHRTLIQKALNDGFPQNRLQKECNGKVFMLAIYPQK